MIETKIARNDLPKLMDSVRSIEIKMGRLMDKVGEMWLDSAQEAIELEGPGWPAHSPKTIKRHGSKMGVQSYADYPLLQLLKGRPPLSNIKNSFTVSFPERTATGSLVRIVPNTDHSKLMTDIHNKPMGSVTIGNQGARIPGRPFFRWRVTNERKKARVLMTKYLGDTFRRRGISMRGLGFEL